MQALKIEFDIAYVNEIFTAVLGLLVVIGIISDPTKTLTKNSETASNQTENKIETEAKVIKETKEVIELPIDEKNETDHVDLKDDLQNVLTTITKSLEERLKKIEELKLNENIQNTNEEKMVEIKNDIAEECDETPAVAENNNPYFDVIN